MNEEISMNNEQAKKLTKEAQAEAFLTDIVKWLRSKDRTVDAEFIIRAVKLRKDGVPIPKFYLPTLKSLEAEYVSWYNAQIDIEEENRLAKEAEVGDIVPSDWPNEHDPIKDDEIPPV